MEAKVEDVHSYEINGVLVRTGDIICTKNGDKTPISGAIWRFIGDMIPGDVDHIAIYVGPGDRCIEAGAKLKVAAFHVKNGKWDAAKMTDERGPIHDTFYGAVYPIDDQHWPAEKATKARIDIANYCIEQANRNRPYNINFLNSNTEDAFYCSQLAYKAYQRHNINLNTNRGVPQIPGTSSIVFPQELWNVFSQRKA